MKKLISLMISMVMIFGSVSFASNYNNQLNNVNKNIIYEASLLCVGRKALC